MRPVSIVTTNFLDTVLDRHSRAVPIFENAGAAVRVDPLERTEVLYLHGHRSAPTSWVLTRSQYDDIENTRPILLTRVRQLFAQHPILTVGFGLADPDFHQIHRQINQRMNGYQPMGLTLLGPPNPADRATERESAFRRHWEKQGIRIVRFKNWSTFDADLQTFLRLPGKLDTVQCERLLCEESDFSKRASLARSILQDPDAEKRIEGEHGWQEALWRACLDADFTDDERQTFSQRVHESFPAANAAGVPLRRTSAVEPDSSSKEAQPKPSPRLSTPLLNEGEGHGLWDLAWMCDNWWQSKRDKAALLDWLHERVRHLEWPMDALGNGSDIRIAELALLLLESTPKDSGVRLEGPLPNDAMRLLRRYAPPKAERLAKMFGHLRDAGTPKPADRDHELLGHMERGFRAALDGHRTGATEAYDKAVEQARRAADPFVLWLAARGRWLSHALRQESEDELLLHKRYRAEHLEAERHPKVVEWQEIAQERLLNLRKLTVEDLRKAALQRAFQGLSMRFTSVPHLAWRSLRDLEDLNAHPLHQRDYLLPLLDHGFGDVVEETGYRLTFDVDGFAEWSRNAIENGASDDRPTYDQRTEALVSKWLAMAEGNCSISAFVTCVGAIPALVPFVRVDHVDRIRRVLESVPERVQSPDATDKRFSPTAVRTYCGLADMSSKLAQGWRGWLEMRGEKADFDAFRSWAGRLEPGLLFDPFDGGLRLRWESLVRAGVSADELVLWLGTEPRLKWLENAHRARFGAPFAVALYQIASIGLGGLTTEPGWRRVGEALLRLMPSSAAGMLDANGFIEGVELVRAALGVLGAWQEHGIQAVGAHVELQEMRDLRSRLEEIVPSVLGPYCETAFKGQSLAEQLPIAGDTLRWDVDCPREWFSGLWERLINQWSDVMTFSKANIWAASHLTQFLAAVIEKNPGNAAGVAQTKVLETLRRSRADIDDLAPVLDPKFWNDDSWKDLMQHIRVAASGARGVFPGSARAAVCDLLRNAVLHTHKPLPTDLRFVLHQVMDLAAHEEALVANHAAYVVTAVAQYGVGPADSELATEIAHALKGIASDARPGVRAAAAYAVGTITESAHAALRSLSGDLAGLAEDSYGQVRREWLLGQKRYLATVGQGSRPDSAPAISPAVNVLSSGKA
jgi:hypothetical protein